MIAYHASNKKFSKFSLEHANTQDHKENFKALWFSTDREYIKQFGKIIYKVNIDTKNFLRESQYNKIDKLVHEFDPTCDGGIGILETENGQKFADFLVSKGYDGYIFPQNDGKTIICFNPNVVTILSSIDETLTVCHGGATKLKAYHGGNLDNGIHNGHLFFTDDIETAKLYGRDGSPDYKLYQCELEFENPLILNSEEYDEFMQSISDWSEPVQKGYDSIICKEDPEYNDPFYYVALNPVKQVKNLKEISKDSIKEDSNLNDKFYKWFGDSKVVDEQGNPLVV